MQNQYLHFGHKILHFDKWILYPLSPNWFRDSFTGKAGIEPPELSIIIGDFRTSLLLTPAYASTARAWILRWPPDLVFTKVLVTIFLFQISLQPSYFPTVYV